MLTLTYYHPTTKQLRSISTPNKHAARDTFHALRRSGYVVRLWQNGSLIH